jgi:hypothetical protein
MEIISNAIMMEHQNIYKTFFSIPLTKAHRTSGTQTQRKPKNNYKTL